MQIIITCGYIGSGSSAVTDLLSEYSNLKNDTASFEYVFLHCPNGVFDLEDKLLVANNALRSDEAIKSFRKQMNNLYKKRFWWVANYKKRFGHQFLENVDNFINEIKDLEYTGKWYMNEYPSFIEDKLRYFKYGIRRIFNDKIVIKDKLQSKELEISFIKPKEFYNAASKFIFNNIKIVCQEDENIILDQFFLPYNLYRMENYLGEKGKAIVVERDPRDIFILNKYFWSKKDNAVPFPFDVKDFCRYYKKMRENEKIIDKNVLRIKFEDLILNYENMVDKIEAFLNLDSKNHVYQKKYFNPSISIANIMVFNKSNKYYDESKYIEEHLSEFLYDFSPYLKMINKHAHTESEVF